MSAPMPLLSLEEALAVAKRIQATSDAELRRAVTTLSASATASLAVLAVQLDAIARAAAALDPALRLPAWPLDPDDAFRAGHLAGLLRAAGYLPIPETSTAEDATHGCHSNVT